jgi:hypothetical protein
MLLRWVMQIESKHPWSKSRDTLFCRMRSSVRGLWERSLRHHFSSSCRSPETFPGANTRSAMLDVLVASSSGTEDLPSHAWQSGKLIGASHIQSTEKRHEIYLRILNSSLPFIIAATEYELSPSNFIKIWKTCEGKSKLFIFAYLTMLSITQYLALNLGCRKQQLSPNLGTIIFSWRNWWKLRNFQSGYRSPSQHLNQGLQVKENRVLPTPPRSSVLIILSFKVWNKLCLLSTETHQDLRRILPLVIFQQNVICIYYYQVHNYFLRPLSSFFVGEEIRPFVSLLRQRCTSVLLVHPSDFVSTC